MAFDPAQLAAITSREPLPIDELLPPLVASLRAGPATVVIAPPGAGKTTRVPPALLAAGLVGPGRVVLLQPRRVAARAAARRIAEEWGYRLGAEVGYRIRFEDRTSVATRLEVVTEGLLTRRLQADPFLEGVGGVVLDEFHERSIHADLGLALLRVVMGQARPDLKLVVMSATLDPDPVVRFLEPLGPCPVLQAAGRLYPVEIVHDAEIRPGGDYREPPLPRRVAGAIRSELSRAGQGQLLAFLPGVGEIQATADELGELPGVLVLPLHGSLSGEAQDRALAPSTLRRVVLATNLAETSVTLEGVVAVVDSGLARQPRFDPALGLERLETVRISRYAAEQRAGRAGRTAAGRCRRLWTAAEQRSLPDAEVPEVLRTDLAATVLELLAWGENPNDFGWFQPPPPAHLACSLRLLEQLGAYETGRITPRGRALAELPLHPRLGLVVLEGHQAGGLARAATAAALASERDILVESAGHADRSDLLLRLELLAEAEQYRWTAVQQRQAGLDPRAVRRVLQVREQLLLVARRLPRTPLVRPPAANEDEALLRVLLAAFPDRVARRREPGSRRFQLVGGSGAVLEGSGAGPERALVLAVTLQAPPRGDRAELRIRVACGLDSSWLPVKTSVELRFDPEREAVVASRVRRYLALVLAEQPVEADDPDQTALLLAQALQDDPRRGLTLDERAEALLARWRCLRSWVPGLELPELAELDPHPGAAPGPLLVQLCRGRRSFAELRRLSLADELRQLLTHRQRTELDRLAPERLPLPGGGTARVTYEVGRPPVLAAPIQRLFGLTATPTVADGWVPVLVHLLAPNGRPVQVTQDLASFWQTTYAEVRKILRGRYPRHRWPERPGEE